MLHDGGELAQLFDLVVVDLVKCDQHAAAVLGQQIGEHLQLVTQTCLDDVRLDRVRSQSADIQRSAHAAHAALHRFGVEVAQQSREVLLGHPRDEASGRGLADDEPAALACAVLNRVEHHRLARTASAGVESRAARRSRAILKGLYEVLEQLVAADQQRRADPEARVKGVLHPDQHTRSH